MTDFFPLQRTHSLAKLFLGQCLGRKLQGIWKNSLAEAPVLTLHQGRLLGCLLFLSISPKLGQVVTAAGKPVSHAWLGPQLQLVRE